MKNGGGRKGGEEEEKGFRRAGITLRSCRRDDEGIIWVESYEIYEPN